jgi:hypothetical protein
MKSSNNDIVNSILSGTATKDEARIVAGWFSSTIEGQQHLSDLLDKDAYLMETQPDTGKSFSPLQSDHLYKKIEKNNLREADAENDAQSCCHRATHTNDRRSRIFLS